MTQRKHVSPREPYGLGGWLIVTAINLVISPLIILSMLYSDYLPIFQQGYWQILTTPGTTAYHHLWAPLLVLEITVNLVFLGFVAVLNYLFFKKSYGFHDCSSPTLCPVLLFVVGDFLLAGLDPPALAEQLDPAGFVEDAAPAFVAAAIWIPYFLFAKRVKNTFVEGRPSPRVPEAKLRPWASPKLRGQGRVCACFGRM